MYMKRLAFSDLLYVGGRERDVAPDMCPCHIVCTGLAGSKARRGETGFNILYVGSKVLNDTGVGFSET